MKQDFNLQIEDICTELNKLKDSSKSEDFSSPERKRKLAVPSYSQMLKIPDKSSSCMDMTMCTQQINSTAPVLHSSVKTSQSYVKSAKKFKLKLSSEKNSTPINQVLAAAAAKGLIDDLDYRSTGTNSIDLLFPTMAEAESQNQKLINNLNDVNISKPDLNRGKKSIPCWS